MKKTTLFLSVIGLFLFGCSQPAAEGTQEPTEAVAPEEHQHDAGMETIVLNGTEKWMVDEPMMVHIRHMESDVTAFAASNGNDHAALAGQLQANLDLLTSNCTMTGQAHDELHKWLLPFIDMVQALSEAKDNSEAATQFARIHGSFETFNQYFQ